MQKEMSTLATIPGVHGVMARSRDGKIVDFGLKDYLGHDGLRSLRRLIAKLPDRPKSRHRLRFAPIPWSGVNGLIALFNDGELLVLTSPEADQKAIAKSIEAHEAILSMFFVPKDDDTLEIQSSKFDPTPKNRRLPRALLAMFLGMIVVGGAWMMNLPTMLLSNTVGSGTAQALPESEGQGPTPSGPPRTILRIQGSNTIGAKLAPELSNAYLDAIGARDIRVEPGKKPEECAVLASHANGEQIRIDIEAHGSSTAFKGLGQASCDIGMASRPIKNKEMEILNRDGLMNDSGFEHVLGLDGIAVIVHPANEIEALTIDQIAAIFSDEVHDWSQIPESGIQGQVVIAARDEKSGTWELFKEKVLQDKTLSPLAERIEDSRALSGMVSRNMRAIGFIGLPYILSSKAVAVAEGSNKPVFPTPFTVATEDYPLARRLFLYTLDDPSSEHARPFLEFALSKNGQHHVEQTGFVPLTISEHVISPPDESPEAFFKLARSSSRLSMAFRFKPGSDRLDSRGQKDVERLVEFLNTHQNRGRSLTLVGFADSIGADEVNDSLSLSRAQSVAQTLISRGLPIHSVLGLGSRLPVADNATQNGREKNRRVEVWVDHRPQALLDPKLESAHEKVLHDKNKNVSA
ncbi:MAG: cell envelope biogenesis protein OmpA [Deltaproteobacteria bacterium]|nr:cell envelope biogenesis protein OmpA [Deltaproteobacteria bacterium]